MATQEQIAIPGAERFEKPTTLNVIERALLDPNLAADKVAALLEVQLRYEANEARKQFETAFQQFKKNAPEIIKTKLVSYATTGGDRTEYQHSELHVITPLITDALLAVGITHQWKTSDANGRTTVTCVLKGFGHTEEAATLSGPADTSGGKNNIQAIGSTVSYLERYTLLAATGLAAKGQDDDGKTEGMTEMAIDEYCIAMNDSSDLPELQKTFKECWEKAKNLNDREAQERLRKVYEARKRSILEARQ